MIKRLRHLGSSYNFLNKFLYHFERSDLEANGMKSLQRLELLLIWSRNDTYLNIYHKFIYYSFS